MILCFFTYKGYALNIFSYIVEHNSAQVCVCRYENTWCLMKMADNGNQILFNSTLNYVLNKIVIWLWNIRYIDLDVICNIDEWFDIVYMNIEHINVKRFLEENKFHFHKDDWITISIWIRKKRYNLISWFMNTQVNIIGVKLCTIRRFLFNSFNSINHWMILWMN